MLFCGQLDFIVPVLCPHFNNSQKFRLPEMLLWPGQLWPTVLLGHTGWHTLFSRYLLKVLNWLIYLKEVNSVSFIHLCDYEGRLKLHLIRTSFAPGNCDTQQFGLLTVSWLVWNLNQIIDEKSLQKVEFVPGWLGACCLSIVWVGGSRGGRGQLVNCRPESRKYFVVFPSKYFFSLLVWKYWGRLISPVMCQYQYR